MHRICTWLLLVRQTLVPGLDMNSWCSRSRYMLSGSPIISHVSLFEHIFYCHKYVVRRFWCDPDTFFSFLRYGNTCLWVQLDRCVLDIFWMPFGCLLGVFLMSLGCLWDVFWMSLGMSLGCLLDAFWMPFGCLSGCLDVFWMSFGCLWDVFWMSFGVVWMPFGCHLDVFGYVLDLDGHDKYQDLVLKPIVDRISGKKTSFLKYRTRESMFTILICSTNTLFIPFIVYPL